MSNKQPNLLVKLFRFFFPKDFAGEFKRGMEMGKASSLSKKLGGGLYDLGKAARKRIDPGHKMKIGKQRRKK
jgi:hypothetical protein